MKNWVGRNLPMVRNLKTNKFIASATNDMALYSGSYSLDIVNNDTIIGSDKSCFSAIWKRSDDNNWEMELMFFGKNE